MAKTDTSCSATRAAATSSCVESGFEAQRTTSAPPAFRVRIRFAVSVVTCRQAETRKPLSGCSVSNRCRIAASTGICRSAHSILRTPSSASARSFTSYRFVVAIGSFLSGGQEPLMLSLFPFQGVGVAGEPRVDGRFEIRLPPQPRREREIGDLDVEAPPELRERAELV